MTAIFRPGKREGAQIIFGVAGSSGSGKTYSLLMVAVGLAYPEARTAEELNAIIEREGRYRIAFIDTERGRALHYAPPPDEKPDPWRKGGGWFPFDHAMMEPPFRPNAYTDLVEAADKAGYAVIIVDSGSHEWSGEGGVLEWHEEEQYAAAKRKANRNSNGGGEREPGYSDLEAVKMTAWIKPKMAHKKMVGKLTTLRAHLLIGLRAEQKVQFVQEYNEDGSKKGREKIVAAKDLPPTERWFPVCEKSFPYELTISFVLVPDEPGVPHVVKLQDQHRPFVDLTKPLSDETGRLLASWARGAKAGAVATDSPGRRQAPPPSPPPPPPPSASSPPKTGGGGRVRTPEEMTQDYISGLAPPPRGKVETLEDLEDYQARAKRFLDGLEERYLSLHSKAMDAYAIRRDEFNMRGADAPSRDELFPE